MANTDYNSLKRQVEAEKKALEKERKNLQNDYENNIKSLNELRIKSNKEFERQLSSLEREKREIQNERLKLEYEKWYYSLSEEERSIHDEKTNNARKEIKTIKDKIDEIDEQLNELESKKSKEVLSLADIIVNVSDYRRKLESGIIPKLIIMDVVIQFIIDCILSLVMCLKSWNSLLIFGGIIANLIVVIIVFSIITSKKIIIIGDKDNNLQLKYYVPAVILSFVMFVVAFLVSYLLSLIFDYSKEILIIVIIVLLITACIVLYTVIQYVLEDCSDIRFRINEYKRAIEVQSNKSKEFDADINILNNEKDKLEIKSNEILEEHYWLKY